MLDYKYISIKGSVESPTRYSTNVMIYYLVKKYCPHNADILDIGCGKGVYQKIFTTMRIKGHYLGIDINKSPLWQTKTINDLKIDYKIFNAEEINQIGHKFNFIISLQMLEHVKNDQKAINSMIDCLAHRGYLTITVPSKYSWFLYGKHGFRRYSIEDIRKLFNNKNCEILETKNIGGFFIFFLHLFLWSSFSLLLKIPIWKLYNKIKFLGKIIRGLEIMCDALDKVTPILEGGYAIVIRKL